MEKKISIIGLILIIFGGLLFISPFLFNFPFLNRIYGTYLYLIILGVILEIYVLIKWKDGKSLAWTGILIAILEFIFYFINKFIIIKSAQNLSLP